MDWGSFMWGVIATLVLGGLVSLIIGSLNGGLSGLFD